MNARWIQLACLIAFIGVGGGAFGAHALKTRLEPDLLAHWDTGARYALFHVSGLVAVAVLAGSHPDRARAVGRAGVAFALGVLLFTGSLWALALTGQRGLGMITPLGGLSLLAGWLLLGLSARGLGRG